MTVIRAALVLVALLAVPAAARAGTVSTAGTTMTYQAGEAGEHVSVGQESATAFMSFGRAVTLGSAVGCSQSADQTRVDCTPPVTLFLVNLFGGGNFVEGDQA